MSSRSNKHDLNASHSEDVSLLLDRIAKLNLEEQVVPDTDFALFCARRLDAKQLYAEHWAARSKHFTDNNLKVPGFTWGIAQVMIVAQCGGLDQDKESIAHYLDKYTFQFKLDMPPVNIENSLVQYMNKIKNWTLKLFEAHLAVLNAGGSTDTERQKVTLTAEQTSKKEAFEAVLKSEFKRCNFVQSYELTHILIQAGNQLKAREKQTPAERKEAKASKASAKRIKRLDTKAMHANQIIAIAEGENVAMNSQDDNCNEEDDLLSGVEGNASASAASSQSQVLPQGARHRVAAASTGSSAKKRKPAVRVEDAGHKMQEILDGGSSSRSAITQNLLQQFNKSDDRLVSVLSMMAAQSQANEERNRMRDEQFQANEERNRVRDEQFQAMMMMMMQKIAQPRRQNESCE